MKKVKYQYNKHTLRYEKIEASWQSIAIRVFGVLCAMTVFGVFCGMLASKFFPSPKERQLNLDVEKLEIEVENFRRQVQDQEDVLAALQERDESIYRTIFEAEPIPMAVREAGFGGGNRYKDLDNLPNTELMKSTAQRIEKIRKQLYIQSKSYDEIAKLVKNKEDMFASIPAIQPVSNTELRRIASGFGMRMHPIYKTRKMHTGMDFSAPIGTSVYATGKGKVVKVKKLQKGYGYHVVIDHGFNYETLYGHLSKINVRTGQRINRGDIIGLVGNTGTSTAPHLHYEVLKNGKRINPINFFYNDLSPEEFDKVLEISGKHMQSFD
ncbi:MAG: M23 family metallopeptidase [Chitinophagales bacterium]